MVYVGVDLHRKSSHVAAVGDDGELLFSRNVPSRPEELLRVFGELGPAPLEVAFEATYGWGWFADLLVDAGIPAHMAHPLATKAISSARVKNDSVDAKTLAHLLRTNLLPEAWIAPPEVREARRLVRTRASLQRIASRLKSQVHAQLADHALEISATDAFGPTGRAELEALVPCLSPVGRMRVEASLRLIDAVSLETTALEQEIRRRFARDDRVRRLLPIPGVGLLTASLVVAEVWDVSRFPSADKLCSWAGLTPSEHSSAEHTRRGHISKQGSRWLRWAMVEAATRPRLAPELRRFYDPIARRRGKFIARVALSRRLLTLCYYALRDETGCRIYPVLSAPTSVRARSLGVMASPPGDGRSN